MDVNKILDYVVEKIEKTMETDGFPHITEKGKWITSNDGLWTGGFWIGLLWAAYSITKENKFKKKANFWLKRLEKRKESNTFDLGFLFYPSYILGFKITGNENLKKVALEAADTQLKTFNEKLKFLFVEREVDSAKYGEMIIDIMPNLKLLWWAYKQTSNKDYYNIADIQSKRIIELLIRSDYSTYQGLIFDLVLNKIVKKVTFQGINVDTCWSRGQAWGIYGFIYTYKATKDIKYLEIAKNLSQYFNEHLPKDYVPYWDFDSTIITGLERDTSAAAIVSSGLIEIYKLTNISKYKDIAQKILNSLSTNYLNNEYIDGILSQGCYYKPKNKGIAESLIFGDYYFVEALLKLKEL